MKADQAVVSQQMLVITPDTTTVSTPNTVTLITSHNKVSLKLVVMKRIICCLLYYSIFIDETFFNLQNQFQISDPLYMQWAFILKFDNVCILGQSHA